MSGPTENRISVRRDFLKHVGVGAVFAGVGGFGVSSAYGEQGSESKVSEEAVDKIIKQWPDKPQEVVKKTIEVHGWPNEATPTHLVWHNNGPWKRSIAYREEVPHNFPIKHTDIIEQVIDYRVPPDKMDELARFDGAVTVRITRGEMSAMCDKEAMNFLALNLAHDIITGKHTVDEARDFQAETVKAFLKGEKHPYTQKFVFDVPKGGTGYPDHVAGEEE